MVRWCAEGCQISCSNELQSGQDVCTVAYLTRPKMPDSLHRRLTIAIDLGSFVCDEDVS